MQCIVQKKNNKIYLSETANPTFVARRQTELNFIATTLLDLSRMTEGMQAGFTGVMLGLFTQSKDATDGYVDVDWFDHI